jgi:hypothetical protein
MDRSTGSDHRHSTAVLFINSSSIIVIPVTTEDTTADSSRLKIGILPVGDWPRLSAAPARKLLPFRQTTRTYLPRHACTRALEGHPPTRSELSGPGIQTKPTNNYRSIQQRVSKLNFCTIPPMHARTSNLRGQLAASGLTATLFHQRSSVLFSSAAPAASPATIRRRVIWCRSQGPWWATRCALQAPTSKALPVQCPNQPADPRRLHPARLTALTPCTVGHTGPMTPSCDHYCSPRHSASAMHHQHSSPTCCYPELSLVAAISRPTVLRT